MRLGKRVVSSMQIHDMIAKCGCALSRVVVQRPIVRTRIPVKCGDILGMDIFYPLAKTGHSRPYLVLADHLSRYTLVCRLNSHVPQHVVDVFFRMWAQSLGKPRRIIADRGPALIGDDRGKILDLFEIQMTLIDRECAFENGTVGRTVGLIKIAFKVIRAHCPALSEEKH